MNSYDPSVERYNQYLAWLQNYHGPAIQQQYHMEQTTSVATSTLPLTSMPSTYGSELPAYHTLLSPQSVMTAQRTFGGEIWQPMHLLHASSEGGAEYPEERRSAFRPILPRPQTILDPPQTTSINSLNSPILSTALTSDKFRFHMPPPLQHQPAPPTMPPPPLVSRPPFQPYSTRVSTPVSSPVSAPAATEPHQTTIHYRMTEQRPQSYQSAATKTTQTDPDIELLERSGQRFLNNFYKTMENNITRNRPISRTNPVLGNVYQWETLLPILPEKPNHAKQQDKKPARLLKRKKPLGYPQKSESKNVTIIDLTLTDDIQKQLHPLNQFSIPKTSISEVLVTADAQNAQVILQGKREMKQELGRMMAHEDSAVRAKKRKTYEAKKNELINRPLPQQSNESNEKWEALEMLKQSTQVSIGEAVKNVRVINIETLQSKNSVPQSSHNELMLPPNKQVRIISTKSNSPQDLRTCDAFRLFIRRNHEIAQKYTRESRGGPVVYNTLLKWWHSSSASEKDRYRQVAEILRMKTRLQPNQRDDQSSSERRGESQSQPVTSSTIERNYENVSPVEIQTPPQTTEQAGNSKICATNQSSSTANTSKIETFTSYVINAATIPVTVSIGIPKI